MSIRRWFKRVTSWPIYCPECGTPLVRTDEPGAGRFASEDWTLLQCPVYKTLRGQWREHYSKVIEHGRRKPKFDPLTGERR